MACQACTSVPGLPAASISVNYPTGLQNPGDFFDITVVTTAGVLTVGTYMVCLYESNQLVDTKSFWIQFGGSVTTVFTVRAINRDMKFNVSGINVGLIWDSCDQFELFTVYAAGPPPPPPVYYCCNPTTQKCEEGASCTDTLAQCQAKGCSAPPPPPPPGNGNGNGGCTSSTDCPTDSMCIFGSCQKRNDVYLAGAIIAGFVILSR